MATELGTGYVSIVAETRQLEAGIKKALQGGGKAAEVAGKDIGSRISAQASKALKSGWRPDQDIMAGIPNTKLDRIGARIGQVIGKGAVAGMRGKQIGAEFGQSFASGVGSVGLGRVIAGWRSELGGRGAMNSIGMVAGKALSSGLTAGAGLAIAGIGLSLTKGFDRLVALDTAKNKLESLNKAAAKFGRPMVDVKQAVQDVTDVVSGTPFSLDEAFGTAVGAIGAGVKDVKGYMTSVADAAAIGGTSMAEMGDVFQDIVNKGNVSGEALARLDTRFPATSWIKASVTASGQDFDALLAKGEITMAMLQQSINDNAAGMAQGLGNTLSGAIMNMQTAVARVGANFLTALFGGQSGDPAQGMKESINTITTKLNELGAWINANKEQIRTFFTSAAEAARGLVGVLGSILGYLKEHPGAIQAVVVAFVAWQGITGIATVVTAIAGLNVALGATAGLAAAALGPLAAIAGIIAGGAIGGATLNNAINSVGAQSEAGLNMLNQATAPGMGVPGASRDPIFQPTPAPAPTPRYRGKPGRADGGMIIGPGTGTSDSIPAMLSDGEHVFTAADVRAMGGQDKVYQFRAALHLAKGGDGFGDKVRKSDKRGPGQEGQDRNPYSPETTPGLQPGQGWGISGPSGTDFGWDWDWWIKGGFFGPSILNKDKRIKMFSRGGAVKKLTDMRTAGAMPAAAGNTAPVGGSALSGIIDMGGELINGVIDQAASAVSTAANAAAMAGSFGAAGPVGGQAAGNASQFAIGLASDTAKRGISYGFDLLGIGVDSLMEQLTPFGQPRLLNQDVSGFVPQEAISGALKNLMTGGANKAAGNVDPNTTEHGTANGAEPGAVPGPLENLGQQIFDGFSKILPSGPIEPVTPTAMVGDAGSFLSTELTAPEAAPPNQQPIFKVDNIYTQDVDSLGRELNKRGRLAQIQYTNRPGP